ncbi:predicted protein [Pyrenophora tritici-repentis Pt-1C-BFP]|uniref:Uncharacterized protein n=1 Tax=Pyrenophora tritici-repentis (strain Pt-1C-BFP) TaxID=426418 RepID=B2W5L8_PYRTR|nr:uncharacterized protein PTRG_04918 [Pyrenophora tritici-repentis Pt-1C-BFP]EDU47825.1 predicted protein [Pyrenophora tritici-repentis Pt-1C-BFP]
MDTLILKTGTRAIGATATPSSNALGASCSAALRPRDVQNGHIISTSAALGIGVVIGIIGIVLMILLALFVHHRRTLRPTQRHGQAKLWKGFEPVTPNTARTSLMDSKMATIYLTVLPTPVMPAFLPSPPPKGPPSRGGRKGKSEVVREETIYEVANLET